MFHFDYILHFFMVKLLMQVIVFIICTYLYFSILSNFLFCLFTVCALIMRNKASKSRLEGWAACLQGPILVPGPLYPCPLKNDKIAKNIVTSQYVRLTRTLLLRSRMALPATSSRVTSTLPTREAFIRADIPCYTNKIKKSD